MLSTIQRPLTGKPNLFNYTNSFQTVQGLSSTTYPVNFVPKQSAIPLNSIASDDSLQDIGNDANIQFAKIRNLIGTIMGLTGIAGIAGLSLIAGSQALANNAELLIGALNFVTTVFDGIDFAFFVPHEIKQGLESIHDSVRNNFSWKSILLILSKLIPVFFIGRWFLGHKFMPHITLWDGKDKGNLTRLQHGELHFSAPVHFLRAMIKNFSPPSVEGAVVYSFAWFGRTAGLKHLVNLFDRHLFKHAKFAPGVLNRFGLSLLYFMLEVLPGLRNSTDTKAGNQ